MATRIGSFSPSGWRRRYPPLVVIVMALLLSIFLLPSALNLPQANPGQTLEYAPVSGGQGNTPPGGNLAGLGLGSSGSGPGGGGAGGSPGQPGASGSGDVPSDYSCVGTPLRQTEDPLSPPCSAFFSGDNGGATYQGVTGTEVRTLFVMDRASYAASDGLEQPMAPGYYDLGQAPNGSENIMLRALRVWQTYFNKRYQTYGRKVHFYVYLTPDSTTPSPSTRESEASDNQLTIHPFAVLPDLGFGNEESYYDATAEKGVLDFGALLMRSSESFARYSTLMWGFYPSSEEEATMYASFICSKAKPNPVSFSGNIPNDDGKPRKFGFIYTTDQSQPQWVAYAKEVEHDLNGCGIDFGPDRGALPLWGGGVDSSGQNEQAEAQFLARFKQDGVTSVLWAGDPELSLSAAAARISYYPEWMLAGDQYQEGNLAGSGQDQNEWANAWVITPQVATGADQVEPSCHEAALSVNGSFSGTDWMYVCHYYDDLRQYFSGIQVAGPRLSPASINEGFRAIPPHASSGAGIPACFYVSADYTCVKDAVAEWWDPHGGGGSGSTTAGCWRIGHGGARYLPGSWPAGDVKQESPGDPCNTYFTRPA